MQKFIKDNYKLLNFLSSILLFALILSCLIGVHNFIKGFLGILLCFLSLNLSFYEDLNNTTCRIISTEYKKNGVHSLFSPFSWEKEWNYHYLYFLTVIKKNKIFGLKFIFFLFNGLIPLQDMDKLLYFSVSSDNVYRFAFTICFIFFLLFWSTKVFTFSIGTLCFFWGLCLLSFIKVFLRIQFFC